MRYTPPTSGQTGPSQASTTLTPVAGTATVEPGSNSVYRLTLAGATTLALGTWPSDRANRFSLVVDNGVAQTLTWPGGATALTTPAFTTNNPTTFQFVNDFGRGWFYWQVTP
jgi:hypothetical protein